jgi:hypothetical protein
MKRERNCDSYDGEAGSISADKSGSITSASEAEITD